MKRGTPEHPKTYELMERLSIGRPHAVGILELLWHFTAKYAIQGDIGKHSSLRIAAAVEWDMSTPDEFVAELVACGWLDEDDGHRLLVHDWADHADQSTKKTLVNRKLELFRKGSGTIPTLSRKRSSTSGSGYGYGSGKAQAQAGHPNDDATCGDSFNAAGDFSRLREVVPKRRVAGLTACRDALVLAVRDGAEVQHIIEQAGRYYATPHSTGQYGWGLLAFIRDGHYDDDPSAWQDRKPTPDTGSTPVYDESAAVKRRAQDDAVRQQHADDPGALARAAAEYQEQHTKDNSNA